MKHLSLKTFAMAATLLMVSPFYSQTASSTMQTINVALRGHQYSEAIQLCGEALGHNPSDYRVWTLKALAYSGSNHTAQALDAYEHALKLSPNYIPAMEGAAQIQYQAQSIRSIPLLKRLLMLDPANTTANGMLAVMEYKQNDCKLAIPHFQQSASLLASQPVAYGEFGACLYQVGQYRKAAEMLAHVSALQPDNQAARYNLALAQWMAKQPQDALTTLGAMLQSSTPDDRALRLAATIEESEGNTEDAITLLRRAILINPKNASSYLQFATLSFNHQSYQVGIDILNAGLTQLPKSPQLYLARGILSIQSSDYHHGLSDIETANKLDPTFSLASTARGLLDSQTHDLKQAILQFRNAIRADPNDAYSHYLLAEALTSQNQGENSQNYREERSAAMRAIEIDPRLGDARDLLATLDLQHGNVQDAITQSRAALQVDPKDQAAIYHLILALRRTSNKSEIPQLVQRLKSLKEASEGINSRQNVLRLVEQSP